MTKQALSLVHDLHNDKCLWSNAAIGRMTSFPAIRASLVLFSPCKAVSVCKPQQNVLLEMSTGAGTNTKAIFNAFLY